MNKALKTLFLFNGILVFGSSLLGPLYTVFVEDLQGSIFIVSFSWAAFLVSSTLFALLFSGLGDKMKEKELLLVGGYLIKFLSWLFYLFIFNTTQLIVLQITLGLAEGMSKPVYDALRAEHLDEGKHVKEYANWKVISSLSKVGGAIIGGFLIQNFGFDIVFIMMASLAFISTVGVAICPRELL